MNTLYSNFLAIAQGISLLFYPHVEVVIHDFKASKIAAIFNNVSKRKIGDKSLIEDIGDLSNIPDIFPVYLQILDQFMERQSDRLSWVRPQSGSIAFLELLLPTPINQLTEKLVEEKGVLIMPGNIFDYPGNFFRIGFGRKNMPVALDLFEEFLNSHALISYAHL